jgi:hypothetical protein
MMDFDELLADNHSLSINQINHSSESIFSAGNHITIDHPNSSSTIEISVLGNQLSRWHSFRFAESMFLTIARFDSAKRTLRDRFKFVG